jgi:choline dehydrogenase-like flavoprotein
MDIPIIHDFNQEIKRSGALKQGVGFFSVSYNPDDGRRSSASVAYIHPILRDEEKRPNLAVLTNSWISKVNISNNRATGLEVKLQDGAVRKLTAGTETILCAGAIDTPRLMLLSGIGPKKQLEDLSIPVVKDIPGVGESLQDHPETIIIWELNEPVPKNQTTMDSDAGIFLRREKPNAISKSSPLNPKAIQDADIADVMMHCYQIPFTLNTNRLGYDHPIDAFCMTPNIPRPRSRGRLYLTSQDPNVKPALDFRYFTDAEGYDADTFVFGIKAARKIAKEAPFSKWLKREVAPGPEIQTDEQISEYARKVAHTVYHPCGTTRMGDVEKDELAVVGSDLRVRGLDGLRIADAGIFPTMTSINPMLTVLGIGERAAEMIAEEAGWQRQEKARL